MSGSHATVCEYFNDLVGLSECNYCWYTMTICSGMGGNSSLGTSVVILLLPNFVKHWKCSPILVLRCEAVLSLVKGKLWRKTSPVKDRCLLGTRVLTLLSLENISHQFSDGPVVWVRGRKTKMIGLLPGMKENASLKDVLIGVVMQTIRSGCHFYSVCCSTQHGMQFLLSSPKDEGHILTFFSVLSRR